MPYIDAVRKNLKQLLEDNAFSQQCRSYNCLRINNFLHSFQPKYTPLNMQGNQPEILSQVFDVLSCINT